jgi:Flp pilus assembly protein TadD
MSLDDRIPESYINLGSLYIREGRTQDGIEEFEAVLAKEPRHVPALMALGMLHEHRKEWSQAEDRYQQVLQVDPTFALAANNLAWLLVERGDGVDRALSYAQRARQARPHDPHIADTLGWVYFHKKMYGQAVGLLKEAVEQLPEQSLAHYHYGMAQFRSNNLTEAKKSFTKFLVLSPRDERAREVRDLLSTLS